MSANPNPFFDTNILLYLLSSDTKKADIADRLLAAGGNISVQVLNEFASTAMRKYDVALDVVREVLGVVRQLCAVESLSDATHDVALDLTERFRFQFYDGVIVAAALQAGCRTLYSEDMQDGQRIGALTIRNPFNRLAG